MSNHAKNVSEKTFQENFVQKLQKYKWKAPAFLDGNKQKVTVQGLIQHWRAELNRINADVLESVPLTDNEFTQVMAKVSQIDNSYEAAKMLAMEQSTGKIDGIYRDTHPDVTREQITLTIFKKHKYVVVTPVIKLLVKWNRQAVIVSILFCLSMVYHSLILNKNVPINH